MARLHGGGVFAARLPREYKGSSPDYRLRVQWSDGTGQCSADPYAFGLLLGELDLHLIAEGRHFELGACLGAQCQRVDGIDGVRFAVWAPNAQRVSVIADFNGWHPARHPMRLRHPSGIWELFIPAALARSPAAATSTTCSTRTAPSCRTRPTRSRWPPRRPPPPPRWWPGRTRARPPSPGMTPTGWRRRGAADPYAAPMSVYEVHALSWLQAANDPQRGWEILAERLVPYVQELGFTHIELLPITEHPFGGSWGYQPLSLYAPTARLGPPQAFAAFIDRCHQAGIGVILDWVPAHFPTDPHGLARFDGTALYEHEDPREGFHQDWNTLIYNLGRNEVRGFLLAGALHWLEHFHADGLRVDAVASMLYRDYSREPGQWVPNRFGGRENLEAVDFLRELTPWSTNAAPVR